MEFRLLGPLEAFRDDGVVPLGGVKQRALLAILLLRANEVVSRDELLDRLWPGRADAGHSLDIQVSRLRKALEPEQPLVTRPGGYVVEVEPERIDARRFESLLDDGRAANAAGRPADAEALLAEALALWRGAALADLAGEPFATVEVARLDELRLVAIEERIDAELALDRHRALVPQLESLAAKHPLRERLRVQLMLALYRSGRQADALRVYDETRRTLLDELGLEPGPDLQRMQHAILRQDLELEAERPAAQRRKRRALLGAAALLVTAAVAGAVVLLTGGGTPSSDAGPLVAPDSVALVSTRDGKVIAQANGLRLPLASRFYRGVLWSLSFDGILNKIDPATGRILGSTNTVRVPCGLAAGEGSVWVTDCESPTVVRVDPAQIAVVDDYPIPVGEPFDAGATQSVAVGAGSLWVGQGFANPSRVYRLDPRTGGILHRYVIAAGGAEALAFGDGSLWVGGASIGRLSRIDPRTDVVTTPARDLGSELCCVAAGGGFVWAAINPAGRVWKLSIDGQIVNITKLPAKVEDLAYADGALWASAGSAGRVVRIDPATDATRAYRFGHHVLGVSAVAGVLAASVQPSEDDVTAGLSGRVIRVVADSDDLDATSTDPLGSQFAFNAGQVQFHYATCAKLFNYPDAAGNAGRRLVPEAAAGWPAVSDGGRTYTFTVRSGFGFSPPSHEQVTAESFRHEIERVLAPGGNTPWNLVGDIAGAHAFNGGTTPHVSGVTARGSTLVIRLTNPAGDLPARLAHPLFCAVPAGLPSVLHGLLRPVPSAGPYYLADRSNSVFVLRPNPNYHGTRPRRLDAIVIRTGVDVMRATAQIARGDADYLQSTDPALAPDTLVSRRAGRRYRLAANNWTELLALNPRRPLFADARTRRAVALALDRRALARGLDGGPLQLPTSRLLPPSSPGAGATSRLSADPATARRLLAGRRPEAVLAAVAPETGEPYNPAFIDSLRGQLGVVGIQLRVVPLRQGSSLAGWSDTLANSDITEAGRNQEDARDPVGYLLSLPYLPRAALARLHAIALLRSPRREAAAAREAARLERDASYIAFSDRATPELVSKRLGCVIDQPEYPGLDLAALCLRR